jgi:hypothetical protein
MMLSSSSSENLKLHLVLEKTQDGRSLASVLEFPDCRVEAQTNEQAIAQLQTMMTHRLANVRILPLEISLSAAEATEDPWMKYAGVFEDDPYFAKIMEAMQAERQVDDDEMDEILP